MKNFEFSMRFVGDGPDPEILAVICDGNSKWDINPATMEKIGKLFTEFCEQARTVMREDVIVK